MKHLSLILTFSVLFSCVLVAQSVDSRIKSIGCLYQDIENNIEAYDTTMINIWDESTEGGQGVAFYYGNEIVLIQVNWLSETGRRQIKYCYNKEQLCYSLEQVFKYNRPIYWNEEFAKEMGDNEVFDPDKTEITESKFYFNNGKLIRWINNENEIVDLSCESVIKKEESLISHASQMKSKLKK